MFYKNVLIYWNGGIDNSEISLDGGRGAGEGVKGMRVVWEGWGKGSKEARVRKEDVRVREKWLGCLWNKIVLDLF